jgi:hypothetical protein
VMDVNGRILSGKSREDRLAVSEPSVAQFVRVAKLCIWIGGGILVVAIVFILVCRFFLLRPFDTYKYS